MCWSRKSSPFLPIFSRFAHPRGSQNLEFSDFRNFRKKGVKTFISHFIIVKSKDLWILLYVSKIIIIGKQNVSFIDSQISVFAFQGPFDHSLYLIGPKGVTFTKPPTFFKIHILKDRKFIETKCAWIQTKSYPYTISIYNLSHYTGLYMCTNITNNWPIGFIRGQNY